MKENLLLLIVFIALVAVGYFWYTQWRQPVAIDVSQEVQQDEFVKLSARIKKININADFFQSPGFLYLQDYTADIVPPKSIGKDNPFLPVFPPESINTSL